MTTPPAEPLHVASVARPAAAGAATLAAAGAASLTAPSDPFDVRRALGADGLLRAFNEAGVLAAADVHVARVLADLAGESDPTVLLAAALAVRGPRLGHVCVDLATVRETATVDAEEPVDVAALAWPEPGPWVARLRASALAGVGEEETEARPLRLLGTTLYLDRYLREEQAVAADLLALTAAPPAGVHEDALADGLARLFPPGPPGADPAGDADPPGGERSGPALAGDGRQAQAAAAAVRHRLAVVAGGPGTGKTTTVARIVALLVEQAAAAGEPPPLVALAAPTGKAAARLEEAVHDEARGLDVEDDVRAALLGLRASTLHRLLGWRPGSHSRFRHHRANRLPHDVVVVDETSMVSLTLMARLVEAIGADARLVLVGDPDQLASVEAGAVLGDIVGPAAAEDPQPPPAPDPPAAQLTLDAAAPGAATSHHTSRPASPHGTLGAGIVVLDRVHRFGAGIAAVAGAVRRGDPEALLAILADPPEGVAWVPADPAELDDPAPLRRPALASARAVLAAASAGDGAAAVEALGAFRLLCAHRRGPHGVSAWTARVEGWLAEEVEGFGAGGRWYVGRPLLVTQNDPALRLSNGDTGVVVRGATGRPVAAFERAGRTVTLSPTRLGPVETVYAMTIHKSQGSQVDTAAVLLPPASSPILTRELLYTAVTRARAQLVVVGTEDALRAAVTRPVARASGLRARLWGG